MKSRFRYILSLALGVFTALPASAQQPRLLSLQDCLQEGLKNNYALQITRNKEEIAHNNATLANAGGLPSVDASASVRPGLTNLDRTVSRVTGEATRNTNYLDNTVDVGVSLSWTIFDGFKIQTNYQQLKTLEQQGETSTRMAVEDLIADISSEYYTLIQQNIRREHYLYAMQLSRERLRIAQVNYETGRFSGLDFHQAEVDYHSDSTALVRQEEAVTNAIIRLNKLMGNADVSRGILIPETSITVRRDLDMNQLWQQTLHANTSLLYASQNQQIAEQDLRKAMSRNYPYLRLNAQYGYNHYNYDISSVHVRDNLGLTGSLTVGYNIFDGNKKRERRNAQMNIRNQKLQREQLEMELHANLISLWQSYTNALSLLELQRKNVEIARNNLEIATDRYKLGNLSGFDMRQVEKNLLDAEERQLQVEYDAKLCEISLLLISGSVSEYLQ